MSVIRIDFNETTDIYLQILRDAQYAEDKKLIGMIRDRLKENAPLGELPASACDIIPFPCAGNTEVLIGDEVPLMFRTGCPQLFVIVCAYFALATASLLLT